MAIGLEIEVSVPIDKLTAAEYDELKGHLLAWERGPQNKKNERRAAAHMLRVNHGKVPYNIIRPANNGFRIDGDHDDRVKSDESDTSRTYREAGIDSIMELVVQPPAVDPAAFNTALTNIATFVDQVNTHTENLTKRWVDALPGHGGQPVSIGPIDWPPLDAALPNHNWQGSIQVNIGIDLREYHNLLTWYVESDYAKPAAGAASAEVTIYKHIREDIRLAVEIGAKAAKPLIKALGPTERAEAGNGAGLRGWLTHLALYLLRSTRTGLAGSAKNAVPVLSKSPNQVLVNYGLTAREQAVWTANKPALVTQLLEAAGRREQRAPGFDPAATLVFPHVPATALTLAQLFDETRNQVPLAGTPVLTGTGVGGRRTGNPHVHGLPTVPGGDVGGGPDTRGGLVAEFRALPKFYDGPAAWAAVGTEFLAQATALNARDGLGDL